MGEEYAAAEVARDVVGLGVSGDFKTISRRWASSGEVSLNAVFILKQSIVLLVQAAAASGSSSIEARLAEHASSVRQFAGLNSRRPLVST